jgi:hypothetical protein
MAKTVAEIDGDSSGLVGSLDKAKVAMGKVGDSSKKLSDQLREVGDQADVAAGNLVNKLGGPGAIKAIGGATIAFAAAQKGVEMFLDSSEKLFRAYGEKGQAVWDDLEKQLFDIQGAFAKAVLQTDDMYVAAGRLSAALQLVKDMSEQAVTAFIGAINILRKIPGTFADSLERMGLFEAFDAMAAEGEARARELTANMDKVSKSFEKPVANAKTLTETIDAMATSYAGLRASSVSVQDQQRAAALENIDNTVKQVEALALLQNMADNMSGDNVGGLTDKQLEDMERLGKLRQDIVDGGKTPAAPAATGGGKPKKEGDKEETVAELVARVGAKYVAYAQLAEEAALLKIENDKTEQQMELDRLKTELDTIEKHNAEKLAAEQRFLDFAAKMEQDHIDEIHARGELTDEEKDARDAERLQAVKDRAGEEMGIYMQTAGKQIALGKLSAKAAADMARSQLGNVIIGLGDKAMAEAGILAAGLNPMAVPMAAAGVAAYAIGNAMMPTAKPSAGETPATEKAEASAPAATNNYAFNMRVDSVFADGESVARQFAMMQESARARGLLMQGA